ncbi:hydroxymethylbilane synthase [Desulfogranum japonicum]|uniref:hydroxymethylbilane synthase n=1 Tax=Desulfogranum japonicum TaxID=231447 RepID=UPI000414120A|nr:hydroxymethylbilane synthase [Desulfogranum japonicum]
MKSLLRIGTRASELAVTQSEWVGKQITAAYPEISIELVKIKTKGDKILDVPLAKVGGKGLFVKEIEDAMLAGEVDLAVHSMKDVPTELPDGLHVPIVPVREIPQDAFVSDKYNSLAELPEGSTVGTSSLRRKAQLTALRPDLVITDLRGNLQTRLKKMEDGLYDAIILAGAGLQRMGMQAHIRTLFSPEQMLPAIGQGALGIELRKSDTQLFEILQTLHDHTTAIAVTAERAFLLRLEGGCQVPIGAYAVVDKEQVSLTGLIASIDGTILLKETGAAPTHQAAELGKKLAESLLQQGGKAILEEVYQASL